MDVTSIAVQDYDIVIGDGTLSKVGELLSLSRKVLVVTDTGVPREYAETVARCAEEAYIVTIPMGEESKNLKSFESLLSAMLEGSFTRGDCVVAVGGGVVGDLSGFAAACYMRGVDFYNIPTTLLSQLDSSIGGKTAVDLGGVKNIVGAFYTPKRVIIDPETLGTLDKRQLRSGLVEGIKMAACFDAALFERIERAESIDGILYDVIVGSLKIKKKVVEEDFKEKGLRAVLNFGHTVGHAVEALGEGKYLHGECVAMGMIPLSGKSARARIKAVLEKFGLETQIEYGTDELARYILHDKKMGKDKVKAVIVDEIGSFYFKELGIDGITKLLEEAK